ncbi:hypothetical protein [Streptomyces vinaceus]|uniref:hypothetical protein n=1 Tax=Streptomyces vinaceus TaxID=1960 RepID=UPI00380B9C65
MRRPGTQNQVWLEIVQIALDLLAWMAMLAPTGQRWLLRLGCYWPCTGEITGTLQRLTLCRTPADQQIRLSL